MHYPLLKPFLVSFITTYLLYVSVVFAAVLCLPAF